MAEYRVTYYDNYPETNTVTIDMCSETKEIATDYIEWGLTDEEMRIIEAEFDDGNDWFTSYNHLVSAWIDAQAAEDACNLFDVTDLTKEEIKNIIWGCIIEPIC